MMKKNKKIQQSKEDKEKMIREYYRALELAEARELQKVREEKLKRKMEMDKDLFLYGDDKHER